jgi:hypothetical protein
VEVSGNGVGQIKAEELGSPLSRDAGVVGGAIPLTGAGAAGRRPRRAEGPVAREMRVSFR